MARPVVATRVATHADLSALEMLWRELKQATGRGERLAAGGAAGEAAERLSAVLDDADLRVVVATVDATVVGMAVLGAGRLAPLSEVDAVHLHHLVVAPGHRHRGIGHALVAAAIGFGDERGLDHVTVSAYPTLRDANRFFARLGFAPLVTRRVAPTAVLRRRIAAGEPGTRLDVIRRRARVRRAAVPVPRASVHPEGAVDS